MRPQSPEPQVNVIQGERSDTHGEATPRFSKLGDHQGPRPHLLKPGRITAGRTGPAGPGQSLQLGTQVLGGFMQRCSEKVLIVFSFPSEGQSLQASLGGDVGHDGRQATSAPLGAGPAPVGTGCTAQPRSTHPAAHSPGVALHRALCSPRLGVPRRTLGSRGTAGTDDGPASSPVRPRSPLLSSCESGYMPQAELPPAPRPRRRD